MAIQIRTSLAEPETGQAFVPHKPARPEKAEGGQKFRLVSEYEPAGDQPTAIRELVEGIAENGETSQVLLGVTGSGKTFTMAKVIETVQRPALIIAPNKILAAQLYGAVSYTHLRAHETPEHLVCRLLLEKKKKRNIKT